MTVTKKQTQPNSSVIFSATGLFATGRVNTQARLGMLMFALLFVLFAAGCTATAPASSIAGQTIPDAEGRIETDLSNFTIPQPILSAQDVVTATVATGERRANVRSGPGLAFDAIAAAASGEQFQVVGKNEAEDWWQICCIVGPGDAADEPSTLAWLADVVVILDGDTETVPVLLPVFDEALEAEWNVDWQCGSERCEVQECTATVSAVVDDVIGDQWLQLDHVVLWDDTCFSTDEWLFEVNTITGVERTSDGDDSFLYRYWVGAEPGEVNGIFNLDDGRQVAAWCSGPHEVEVEVDDGWTTVYTGNTCHDVRTGMLLSLSYEKRWLFTGEFEGNSYEREYFGDYEILDQHLSSTTAELAFVEEN